MAEAASPVLLEAHTTAEGGCATRIFPLLADASTCTPLAAFVHRIFGQRTKLFLPSLARRKTEKFRNGSLAAQQKRTATGLTSSRTRSKGLQGTPDTSDVLPTRPIASKRKIYICFQTSRCISKSAALYTRRAPQSNHVVGVLDASAAKWKDSGRFEAKRSPARGVFGAF